MNFRYDANISFPLKIVIGAEQTGQTTCGDTGPHLREVLNLNTYDLLTLLALLLVFCLFYKVIVSCINKCVTEPLIKLMMIR